MGIGDMAVNIAILETLKAIMLEGGWETEESFMAAFLKSFPKRFTSLFEDDAMKLMHFGNEFLVQNGGQPCHVLGEYTLFDNPFISNVDPQEKETIGKCVDLWGDEPAPKKFIRPTVKMFEKSRKKISTEVATADYIYNDPIKSYFSKADPEQTFLKFYAKSLDNFKPEKDTTIKKEAQNDNREGEEEGH